MKTFSANNICQSCGLPMYHLSDFGTNEDDTINTDYCHFCFTKGIFIDHGISLDQKIESNKEITQKTGMTLEKATLLAHKTRQTIKK